MTGVCSPARMEASVTDAVTELLRLGTLSTPAFVYDEGALSRAAVCARETADAVGCRLLYSVKACSIAGVVRLIATHVDGLACSSVFEAAFAKRLVTEDQTVHLFTPGVMDYELPRIADLCNFLTINSLPQWSRLSRRIPAEVMCGLRMNPGLSLVDDPRYDPCRPDSKLGIPLPELAALDPWPDRVVGLHLHNNCDSLDWRELERSVERVESALGGRLPSLRWINLGGGYLVQEARHVEALRRTVDRLSSRDGLDVFIEPGAALVRDAGFLVASVLDLFKSGDHMVAVLDTSVNHAPEVFEYQYSPPIAGSMENGKYRYVMAGRSCLAGDLFGQYGFDEPLEIGSRVVFTRMGAYTTVKMHYFNGVNLPSIYRCTTGGELVLDKQYQCRDYLAHCGVDEHAGIRT